MATTYRILRDRDVQALITVDDAITTIEDVYREYGRTQVQILSNPPAMFAGTGAPGTARFKAKAASLESRGVTAFRLVSDLPAGDRLTTKILQYLYDNKTGLPLGLVDETWLHSLRTALTGVIAAKHLARADSRVAAIIGAGAIANELFPALTDAFALDDIRVVARRLDSARRFVDRHAPGCGASMRAVPDAASAIEGADIIFTLTFAESAIVRPGMLAPGAFLCSMGEVEEVAYQVLDEVDTFVVDEFVYATQLGDIAAWIKNGDASRVEIERAVDANIGQIVSGASVGRRHPEDRVYAIIQGMAICDLALAMLALEKSEERGLGINVPLFDDE